MHSQAAGPPVRLFRVVAVYAGQRASNYQIHIAAQRATSAYRSARIHHVGEVEDTEER